MVKVQKINWGAVKIKIHIWMRGVSVTTKWYPPLMNNLFFGTPSPPNLSAVHVPIYKYVNLQIIFSHVTLNI